MWQEEKVSDNFLAFNFFLERTVVCLASKTDILKPCKNENQKVDLFYDLSGSFRPWGLEKVEFITLG